MAKVKEEKKEVTMNELVKSFMKKNKEDFYNFEEEVDYLVSSGSLRLDVEMEGGFGPGSHRLIGPTGSGKSAFALEVARNFSKMENARIVYIKAEGRLGKQMKERTGLKFTTDPEEWNNGDVLVIETNIYEQAAALMYDMITNNPQKLKFMFIVDSVDGLLKKSDSGKSFDESSKVAGGAVVASDFLKRISIPMTKRGHMVMFISQLRSQIKIDTYSPADPKVAQASGGYALEHYPNWIFDIQQRFGKDLITKDGEKPSDKNPIIGHVLRAKIKKSENEKTGGIIEYPIRYGRKGGSSVWVEREVVELMVAWECVRRGGAYFTFDEDFYREQSLESTGLEMKYQGIAGLYAALDSNPDAVKIISDYFKKLLKQ